MGNSDILAGSSSHSKEVPSHLSLHLPTPALCSASPHLAASAPRGEESPGRDALKSTRLFALQLALGRVLLPTSRCFYSTNNCMRAGVGEAEKDLGLLVFSSFITLLASSVA